MMNILFISESTQSLLGNLIFLNCNQKYKGRKYFELKEGKKKKLIPSKLLKEKKICNVFED